MTTSTWPGGRSVPGVVDERDDEVDGEVDAEDAAWRVLRRTACAPRGPWARLEVVGRTGSTNADLAAAAAAGPSVTPDRTVLVAHHQDAGRGRRDRVWESRPGSGLTTSVLLRPHGVDPEHWGWAPLLVGVALVLALEDGGVPVALKWPNDLLVGPAGRKGAGILAEVAPGGDSGPALVIGVGVNVTGDPADLPPGATSLRAEGLDRSRTDVLGDLLAVLASLDDDWRAAGGDAASAGLRTAYVARCATVGRPVRVTLPGDRELRGEAVDVDGSGRLVVVDERGRTSTVTAGDVVHVRPTG